MLMRSTWLLIPYILLFRPFLRNKRWMWYNVWYVAPSLQYLIMVSSFLILKLEDTTCWEDVRVRACARVWLHTRCGDHNHMFFHINRPNITPPPLLLLLTMGLGSLLEEKSRVISPNDRQTGAGHMSCNEADKWWVRSGDQSPSDLHHHPRCHIFNHLTAPKGLSSLLSHTLY